MNVKRRYRCSRCRWRGQFTTAPTTKPKCPRCGRYVEVASRLSTPGWYVVIIVGALVFVFVMRNLLWD